MIDAPVPTLWCDGTDPLTAAQLDTVRAWCAANPPGWCMVGEHALGTDAYTPGHATWRRFARLAQIKAHTQHAGVEMRVLVSFRVEVLQPYRSDFMAPAAGLDPAWVARSTTPWQTAVAQWAAKGWTLSWPDTFDPVFLAALPADAALYTLPNAADPATRTLPITGVLANMVAPGFRDWMVEQAHAARAWWHADGLMVGAKPWLRYGQPHMAPGVIDPSNGIVQPTPYGPGQWQGGMAFALMALADSGLTVTTLTRPPQPPLATYIGAGPQILGESQLTMLN